jgi:tetratricopeptide (TPR) repeat protein
VPTAVPVDQVRALEQRFAQDSTNVGLRIRLAAAYRSGDRFEEARRLLEPVVRADPLAAYHLALVNEELSRWAAARTLYQDYLQRGRDPQLQQTVRTRLALVQRLELEQAVRSALNRERELAGTTPAPRTVGVFPFLLATTDTTLRALGTALAELLTTDLAQTERLRVLERVRVQMLLDEMKLGASGRVDAATAARSGASWARATSCRAGLTGAKLKSRCRRASCACRLRRAPHPRRSAAAARLPAFSSWRRTSRWRCTSGWAYS